jgi:hypothetical protein
VMDGYLTPFVESYLRHNVPNSWLCAIQLPLTFLLNKLLHEHYRRDK